MGKVLKKIGGVLLSPLSLIDPKLGQAVAAVGLTVLGVVTGNPLLISAGLSIGSSLLATKPGVPGALAGMQDRLNVSIDLRTPRTMVIGHTAQRADIEFLPL